jgi:3-methyladenine DNA glycosylase AlkD
MDQKEDTAQQVRDVKRLLRAAMNGPVSQSMREKGLTYRVNFGVELPRLQAMAEDLPHTYALAAALWKEDVRECRLLAAILMPTEAFAEDLADVWVEQMHFQEEAEWTVLHLFARLPYASAKVFEWLARDDRWARLCGLLLMVRLLMQGARPAPRDVAELIDQAAAELRGTDYALRQAAYKLLLRLAELGEEEERTVDGILEACGV